jgi:Putative zinc-finger
VRCSKAGRQLQLYIDDRLPLKEVYALEAHLVGCTDCREELLLLAEAVGYVRTFRMVAEPGDLTARIMERVAVTPQRKMADFSPLRPSLAELLVVVLLATITTLGVILAQPSVRAVLPFATGHDVVSLFFLNSLHQLLSYDMSAFILALWIVGALLGVFITLLLVGEEVRSQWLKAMMDRLPVR